MQCAQSDDKPRHAGLRPDPLTRKIEKGRHNRRSIRAPTPIQGDPERIHAVLDRDPPAPTDTRRGQS
jgi:hypothetical protein